MPYEARGTQVKLANQYNDRWSMFGEQAGIAKISGALSQQTLRQFDLFKSYDDNFLKRIIPDVSIATWLPKTILFEQGTYIDLAFYIVQGEVEIYLDRPRNSERQAEPYFDPYRTSIMQPNGSSRAQSETSKKSKQPRSDGSKTVFLATMDFNLTEGRRVILKAGDFFGEIGAMNGWPQSTTARTLTHCEVIQVRLPALRAMKRKSSALKEQIDAIYRERALATQLRNTPLFRGCNSELIDELTEKIELNSFGPDEQIAAEGDKVDGFYLIRSGFVKLTRKLAAGEMVVSYLSKGMTLGETELLIDGLSGWQNSAYSVEHSEIAKLSKSDFEAFTNAYPKAEKYLWNSAIARIKEAGASQKRIERSEFLDSALQNGLVEGTSILMIDLNSCTRCDDCVRGCAATHDGMPRFVREGEKIQNFLVARSCYHCHDPVCLIGCPTGAIRRVGGQNGNVVDIEDDLCIGCQQCARNCPYDAITMVDSSAYWSITGNKGPEQRPKLIASKCDLCYESKQGPACVNNCPQGCLSRVNSIAEFQNTLK